MSRRLLTGPLGTPSPLQVFLRNRANYVKGNSQRMFLLGTLTVGTIVAWKFRNHNERRRKFYRDVRLLLTRDDILKDHAKWQKLVELKNFRAMDENDELVGIELDTTKNVRIGNFFVTAQAAGIIALLFFI